MKFLFSLIPFYGIAGFAVAFSSLMGVMPMYNAGSAVIMAIIAAVIALFGIISTFVSIFTHTEQLGKIIEHKKDVEDAEEYLEAAKEHVKTVTDIAKELDESVLAKSSVDHPAVKAMNTLTSAQSTLKNAKSYLNTIQGRIAARKVGPFGWVVSMYGEG